MEVAVLITTCNRQDACQRLVDSLQGQADIFVYNDGGGYIIEGATNLIQQRREGRIGYWKTVNGLFAMRTPHRYYIMMPDDFMPVKDMIRIAIETWVAIPDRSKICLNLYADRLGQQCWTGYPPHYAGITYQTQWVDMCFLCEEPFFKAVGMIPYNLKRGNKNNSSSGVGRFISWKLHGEGFYLYQVKESLVIPQKEHYITQMHTI